MFQTWTRADKILLPLVSFSVLLAVTYLTIPLFTEQPESIEGMGFSDEAEGFYAECISENGTVTSDIKSGLIHYSVEEMRCKHGNGTVEVFDGPIVEESRRAV
jgi:hypothetical protein